ncbi:MAG TPA: bifunctional serine/threonine-protein kinase/ABC transporter substrate-binding protein [Streptosporangiaceae bacterium]|nr:bifunctional serine/threonine-protein kinase/ABC transporter substrate-binding protein [Streptosporangiaceae bacterium]
MLLGRLGAGGMGQVFLGRSPGGRLVAVKVIRAELAGDTGFRARFAREVVAARKVSGVFTAAVVDADPAAPLPWLVTSFVTGLSLADAVGEHGALPVASVLALAAGLAEGLGAIHAAGVVHRDLKPSNVLLAADGPRVIDFGISRAVDAPQLTRTGMVIGSPAFMSPEQVEGGAVGPASDVFSLGAVLVFAATGQGPFGPGAPTALMYRVVHGTPRLDQLPGPVRPLAERCLAKDPGQRPTAAQFLAELTATHPSAADLADWLPASILAAAANVAPNRWPSGPSAPVAALAPTLTEETGSPVQPAGAAGTAAGKRRRRRWAVSVIAAVMVIIAAGVGLAVAPGRSTASSHLRAATRPGTPAASCQASGPANGQTRIIAWKAPQDVECVGYSDSGFVFTNHAPGGEAPLQALQDERLWFDQQQVFQLNQRADQAHENGQTEFSLVYFAGITAGPDENYDSGQAEELEGLMVAQELALQESGPVFKVIIANGGSKMQDAVPVARMIIALAARDPGLLGVVGLDRSIQQVKQTIGLFNASGIPVVATTLSADGIGGTYPHYDRYYFQLSSSNSVEANLILHYVQEVVPQYFKQSRQKYNSAGQIQAKKILIFLPSADQGDLFTSTLVGDLKREAPLFKGLPTLPTPQVTQQLGSQLCGAATVVIYAGRHDRPPTGSSQLDDFSKFLRIIEDDCHTGQKPFIIADDGVSRFIADPAARDQPGLGEPAISYVTNGIQLLDTGSKCLHTATAAAAQAPGELFSSFCTTYAAIVNKLFNLPKVQGQGLDFLWTGERVGLAFDAADLFLDAEENYQSSHTAIGRAEIPGQFVTDTGVGVTGPIDFTASQHIASLPLAVVRIRISSPTATPTCGYLGQGQLFGPRPGTGPCPDGSG